MATQHPQKQRLMWSAFRRHVYAHDLATGEVLWTYRMSDVGPWHMLCVDRGVVFIVSHGYIYALDAETGAELWTNPMRGKGIGFAHIVCSPLCATSPSDPLYPLSALIWVALRGAVYALSRESGEVCWSYRMGKHGKVRSRIHRTYLSIERNIVLAGQDGVLHAIDAVHGEKLWVNSMRGHGMGSTTLISVGSTDFGPAYPQ